jgi:hypothetical protein
VALDGDDPAGVPLQDVGVAGHHAAGLVVEIGAVDREERRLQRRVAVQLLEVAAVKPPRPPAAA